MSKFISPFPFMISINIAIILSLFMAIIQPNIHFRIYGLNLPQDNPPPLALADVYHMRTNNHYLTYTDGTTEEFGAMPEDSFLIHKDGYKSLNITIHHLPNRFIGIGVTLYRNTSTKPALEGVISNGLALPNISISCEGCSNVTTTTRTDGHGKYSFPINGGSLIKTLHIFRFGIEVVNLEIKPETNNDHAKIDVGFDDSSPIERFFSHTHHNWSFNH